MKFFGITERATCEKCNSYCKLSDCIFIYSMKKSPYYIICNKCSILFNQFVITVPKGCEAGSYLAAVRYMFKEDKQGNTVEKSKCDMCRKESTIVPTSLGSYLGEKNPNICDHCKDILEPLSEQVVKLIIWEINKLQEK